MTLLSGRRAIVFDLDGTLVDSLTLVLQSIAHALEPFEPRRPSMEIFAKLGGPPERFLPTLLRDVQHVPTARQRMDTYHRENWHLIRPFHGVSAALADLRAARLELGIWTGRDRESAERILREHQLDRFFGAVVCGDDLPSHKPDPEGLRGIMRRLGVGPNETLLVGDADVDVLGGVACGVDTLLIGHAREIDRQIRARCWRVVTTPVEALELLLNSARAGA